MAMNTLFKGKDLVAKDGSTVKPDSLSDKIVGIYFSAHWCPPCKAFTPKAAETYKALKESGKNFEMVFASSDKDQAAFDAYYAEMPWLALPFEHRDVKNVLSKKFKVSGIPTLVLLDGNTGKIICKDGRSAFMKDPQGAKFPWIPPTVFDAIGPTLVKPDGTEVSAKTALDKKYVGIYFSAHWCPPCRGFTPVLAETYKKICQQREDFEIVFASGDRDDKGFKEYFATMPWLALPFAERDRQSDLSDMFDVEGIPTFVIIGPDGNIINKDTVGSVQADPEGKNFPWSPSAYGGIEEAAGSLNESAALIVFYGKGAEDKATEAIKALAVESAEKAKAENSEEDAIVFCTADTHSESVVPQVRKLCSLEGSVKDGELQMVMLDIPDDGAFYLHDGEVSDKTVRSFVEAYRAKTLERKQLSRG